MRVNFCLPLTFHDILNPCKRQGCNLWHNWFKLPPFCLQPVAALAGCQQRPERWLTEVLDFCTRSHKSSSFTRRKSCTSNNPVLVLCIPSKYGWMSRSLNESNLNQLHQKLQPCTRSIFVSFNIFWSEWARAMGWVPNCLSCQSALNAYASWPISVKLWPWPCVTWGHIYHVIFQGLKVYESISLDERNTMVAKHCSIPNSVEVINKKYRPWKLISLVWPDMEGQRSSVDIKNSHHWIPNVPSYFAGLCCEAAP